MYNVPTPYLRMWKSSGELLNLEQVEAILGNSHIHSHLGSNDARHYDFGRLVIESHPFLDYHCCSLHMCMLEERLSGIMSSISNKGGLEYLLLWLSVIGPYVGFPLSASAFVRGRDRILREEHMQK